ncbi:MAG: dethiobiotin synthase [Chitinispirillia bacterium]|nr:dethiobiotin synthase [Chitinispirillia bacterium]MCL2267748.1 dethiobiotin synthase [Chitinispirillia bacterium]
MAKSVFVAGTGTDIGKTYASKMLLKNYAELGHCVTYMKPVETGCAQSADGEVLAGADTQSILELAVCKTVDLSLHSPFRFAPACSPHLAMEMSGRQIDMGEIVSAYEKLNEATSADITIVEGVGGILTPLNKKGMYVADIIKALAIPAMLVVAPTLGTLNLTFMSLHIFKHYNIPVAGIIINNAYNMERDFIYEDNIKTIRNHIDPVPCLDINYNDMSKEHLSSDTRLLTGLFDEIATRR